jgi:hypothetical protein
VTWFDHHYWSRDALNMLRDLGVEATIRPEFASASELLLETLSVDDELSRSLVSSVIRGPDGSSPMSDWLTAFLSVQDDHYEIRHFLAPLFEGRVDALSSGLIEAGREVLLDANEQADLGAAIPFPLKKGNGVLIGLPPSSQSKYGLIADRLAVKKAAAVVMLFFDGVPQILVRRGIDLDGAADFVAMADYLGKKTLGAVRLYDRNMILIEPVGDIREEIERIMKAMESWPA